MTLSFPGLTDERFKQGYLEIYIDTPRPVQICVALQQSDDLAHHCPPKGFAAPDGKAGYQRIQIPLIEFESDSTKKPITAAQLAKTKKLMPGANWGKGTVYVDDVVIRY